jgi:hypothetical protein
MGRPAKSISLQVKETNRAAQAQALRRIAAMVEQGEIDLNVALTRIDFNSDARLAWLWNYPLLRIRGGALEPADNRWPDGPRYRVVRMASRPAGLIDRLGQFSPPLAAIAERLLGFAFRSPRGTPAMFETLK